jgi:hypothetical protein
MDSLTPCDNIQNSRIHTLINLTPSFLFHEWIFYFHLCSTKILIIYGPLNAGLVDEVPQGKRIFMGVVSLSVKSEDSYVQTWLKSLIGLSTLKIYEDSLTTVIFDKRMTFYSKKIFTVGGSEIKSKQSSWTQCSVLEGKYNDVIHGLRTPDRWDWKIIYKDFSSKPT